MNIFNNFEEFLTETQNAQKNKLKNINCYLLPNETESLINKKALKYLKNENTLQIIMETDRFNKIYFYGDQDFTFIPFQTNKPILIDLPYSGEPSEKIINLRKKLESQNFFLNSSTTRMNLTEFNNVQFNSFDYIIEKIKLAEIDEIYNIWEENFDAIENLLYSKNEIKTNKDSIYVLKNKNNEILGVMEIILNNNVAWIQKIAIKKSFHGKGLGAILEKFCLNLCKTLGIKNILLYTVDSHIEASVFHKKFGFKPDGKFNYQYVKR